MKLSGCLQAEKAPRGSDRAGRSPSSLAPWPPTSERSFHVTPLWGQCASTADQKGIWDSYICRWLLSCFIQKRTVLEQGSKWLFSVSSTVPAGRCSTLTPLVLIPGDGPAAPGDLQWMLRPAPGHWPASPGCGGGARGAQRRALPLPVHRDHRTQHTPGLVHGHVTGRDWKMLK